MLIATSDVSIKCVEGYIRHGSNTISMKKSKVIKKGLPKAILPTLRSRLLYLTGILREDPRSFKIITQYASSIIIVLYLVFNWKIIVIKGPN